LPAADLRSADEPLLGTTDPEPTQAPSPGNAVLRSQSRRDTW